MKTKISILGTGLVGSDLLVKVMRSPHLECVMFAGQREDSPGIARAKKLGIPTSIESITAIPDETRVVFDCTTAKTHLEYGAIFNYMDKFVIDLTPSRAGKMCVPLINLGECLKEYDVNLVSCGAQAMTPLAKAIMDIQPCEYMELVSTIASKSAGIGTRDNIDEFTQTTADALVELGGVPNSKAIIILNPAEPPINMRNTLYCKIKNPDIRKIRKAVDGVVRQLQEYIPGYELIVPPTYEKGQNRLTMSTAVAGRGDYLPKYAGNLDVITSTAIKIAETYAKG